MRVLITGGSGFLGAWIVRKLHETGHELRVLDLSAEPRTIAAIAGAEAAAAVTMTAGDVADGDSLTAAAAGCDAIIHLAGMLTAACAADPLRGARVNLMGTLNVFEAARRHGIARLAYASSAAVFGPEDGTTPCPVTHYGAFKLAGEGAARAYHREHGLGSTGFRPYIIYGPGRDSGMTAGPTLACRAAVRGEAFHIPYSGSSGMVYVEDVADAFCQAVAAPARDAEVFNLSGEHVRTEAIAEDIRAIVPGAAITAGGPALPFPAVIPDEATFARFPGLPRTTLREGIGRTIAFYRASSA